jgi:hypothetical protein
VNASDLDGTVAAASPEVASPDVVPSGVITPGDPSASPSGGVNESDAPAAGFAVMISGTTQAAAPAVATTDMRPNAWRLERVRPDGGSPGAAGHTSPSPCDPCLCI